MHPIESNPSSGVAAPSPGSANCHKCKHCGPPRLGETIRCDSPTWKRIQEPDDSEMREIHPTFAEECEEYSPNAKSSDAPEETSR
jgi:hypothetical protein